MALITSDCGSSLRRANSPLAKAFLAAGAEAGYPATDDISGYKQVRARPVRSPPFTAVLLLRSSPFVIVHCLSPRYCRASTATPRAAC